MLYLPLLPSSIPDLFLYLIHLTLLPMMASNTTTNGLSQPVISTGFDPSSSISPNTNTTTFVQADPSTFRTIVQKLTGAPEDPSTPKLPITLPSRLYSSSITTTTTTTTTEMGPRKPPFKLHERRQSMKKLELNLHNNGVFVVHHGTTTTTTSTAPTPPCSNILSPHYRQRGYISGYGGGDLVLVSPVSPLDYLFCRGSSPRTPPPPQPRILEEEEEIRAIAEKGFYLHPSPLSTPRESEPELLPLFPLHSPRDDIYNHHCSSSSS